MLNSKEGEVVVVVGAAAVEVQPEVEAEMKALRGRRSASPTIPSGRAQVVHMSITTTESVATSTSVLPALRRLEPENLTRLITALRRLPAVLQWGLVL